MALNSNSQLKDRLLNHVIIFLLLFAGLSQLASAILVRNTTVLCIAVLATFAVTMYWGGRLIVTLWRLLMIRLHRLGWILMTIYSPMHPELLFFSGNRFAIMRSLAIDLDSPEEILFAAVKHPGGTIFGVVQPGRHHHIIHHMDWLGIADTRFKANTRNQGFITTHGRFIDRVVGLEIATARNQIVKKHPSFDVLYSEDMWP